MNLINDIILLYIFVLLALLIIIMDGWWLAVFRHKNDVLISFDIMQRY